MLLEMVVKGLTLDPLTNMPIVVLSDPSGKKSLPIWIGIFEANAIAMELEKVASPRPMTHDLLRNIIANLDAKIVSVIINNLRNNTFYARINLTHCERDLAIDSRPSDAIALAIRCNVPIYVEDFVIEQAQVIDASKDTAQSEDWKEWLEKLKPEDFGKYQM